MIIRHVRTFAQRAGPRPAARLPKKVLPIASPPPKAPPVQRQPEAQKSGEKARKNLPLPWLITGTLFVCATSYVGVSFWLQATKEPPKITEEHVNLNAVYDSNASSFDSENNNTEYWLGISKLRRKLAQEATGDVLESAAGTGRNLRYYNSDKVTSLTLADKNQSMLDVAKDKWEQREMVGSGWRSKVGFIASDLAAETPAVDAKNSRKFDTIIQTFAVCSTDNPEQLLRNLGSLVKEDGKIIILEHGKGHYDWLNRALDNSALNHAKRFGCWWNRDIGAIVERSGLQIVEAERYTLGTSWWFVLKPAPGTP